MRSPRATSTVLCRQEAEKVSYSRIKLEMVYGKLEISGTPTLEETFLKQSQLTYKGNVLEYRTQLTVLCLTIVSVYMVITSLSGMLANSGVWSAEQRKLWGFPVPVCPWKIGLAI